MIRRRNPAIPLLLAAGWLALIQPALAGASKPAVSWATAAVADPKTYLSDISAKLEDPDDPLNQHARQIRQLAAEYHVGLVDSLATFLNVVHTGGKLADLMAQVNHPDRKGHELVAAELLKWFPVNP
jgi:hypothetical protein